MYYPQRVQIESLQRCEDHEISSYVSLEFRETGYFRFIFHGIEAGLSSYPIKALRYTTILLR